MTDTCPDLAAIKARVRDLELLAGMLDPGIGRASFSNTASVRRKQQLIAAHWHAVGIRQAIDELGLRKDAS